VDSQPEVYNHRCSFFAGGKIRCDGEEPEGRQPLPQMGFGLEVMLGNNDTGTTSVQGPLHPQRSPGSTPGLRLPSLFYCKLFTDNSNFCVTNTATHHEPQVLWMRLDYDYVPRRVRSIRSAIPDTGTRTTLAPAAGIRPLRAFQRKLHMHHDHLGTSGGPFDGKKGAFKQHGRGLAPGDSGRQGLNGYTQQWFVGCSVSLDPVTVICWKDFGGEGMPLVDITLTATANTTTKSDRHLASE
jgi:hypothetical protein